MAKILHHAVPGDWRKEQKYQFLEKAGSVAGVKWKQLKPDKKHNWLDLGFHAEFDHFLPLGDRAAQAGGLTPPIFKFFSNGIKTHRDDFAVNFSRDRVAKNMEAMIEAYNGQVDAYHRLKKKPAQVEDFIDYESGKIAWSDVLKKSVARGVKVEFTEASVRPSLYRPFTSTWLYFDPVMNERRYGFPDIFPKLKSKNLSFCVTDAGGRSPFSLLASDRIVDLHLAASTDTFQCFPLHVYAEDGKTRQDNVTLPALVRFQNFYGDDEITRADIFHYVYAVLHHPAYRTRYAENLKRELPRIPLIAADGSLHAPPAPSVGDDVRSLHSPPPPVGDEVTSLHSHSAKKGKKSETPHVVPYKSDAACFHAFAAAGKQLADLHVNYESAKEFPLKRVENKEVPLDWRVEAMKLIKPGPNPLTPSLSPSGGEGASQSVRPRSKSALASMIPDAASPSPPSGERAGVRGHGTTETFAIRYNDFLTLEGIPPEAFDYRLGNRSALDWVIDQYRVTRDEKGNIASDPNRMDDEQYIVRLLGQVITVSLETQKVVKELPELKFP